MRPTIIGALRTLPSGSQSNTEGIDMKKLTWLIAAAMAVGTGGSLAALMLLLPVTAGAHPPVALPNQVPACVGNDAADKMVKVGATCVDVFEASVWSTSTGGTQHGAAADDYPCGDDGNDCTGATAIYARSQVGVTPSRFITWFQAQQACANAGKRLLTNAEWQMAAAGTPDPGVSAAGSEDCNTANGGGSGVDDVVPTGSRDNCVSNHGVTDMGGNLNDWVADWIPAAPPCSPTLFGSGDSNCMTLDPNSSFTPSGPAALIRGGDFINGTKSGIFAVNGGVRPDDADAISDGLVGFRCAR